MFFIGIGVHKRQSQICILDEQGAVHYQTRVPTSRPDLADVLRAYLPARVVLEASAPSEWVARHLESLGLEVIVADPGFAPMYATRDKKIKTDRRDAHVGKCLQARGIQTRASSKRCAARSAHARASPADAGADAHTAAASSVGYRQVFEGQEQRIGLAQNLSGLKSLRMLSIEKSGFVELRGQNYGQTRGCFESRLVNTLRAEVPCSFR